MKKKYLNFSIRFFFSAVIIVYFLHIITVKYGSLGEGIRVFFKTIKDISSVWAGAAFLLHFAGISLMSLRWKVLLKAQGFSAKYHSLYLFNLMAAFFNNFLPSTIGGDVIKGLESGKITGDKTTSFTVIIVERISGMAALILISLSALSIKYFGAGGPSPEKPGKFILIIIFGITVFIFISIPKINIKIIALAEKFLPLKLSEIIKKAFNALGTFYKKPLSLLTALVISFAFQFNMVLYYYFISRSIGMSPGFIDFMIRAPMLIFLLMTVPTVNGIGVRTAVFSSLMKFPVPAAMAVEAVDIILRMILGLIGGGVYLFYKRDEGNKNQEMQ